jgi:hypothetical protein
MVVRDGRLLFMSPQQQHEFNFPYQIGSPDSMSDTPKVCVWRGGMGRHGWVERRCRGCGTAWIV